MTTADTCMRGGGGGGGGLKEERLEVCQVNRR